MHKFQRSYLSGNTYSLGDWFRNDLSCSNAVPAIILTRKTFTRINKWYLPADTLSNDENEV